MQPAAVKRDRPVPFVTYIEGLRGLFGLVVVIGHFRLALDNGDLMGPTGALIPGRAMFLTLAGACVCMFLLISGFVLMIPIALRGRMGSVRQFMQRRARRMIPPFYAAIVLSVPLWLWSMHLEHVPVTPRDVIVQVVSHLLFLHDITYGMLVGLNGAMWSIAVEWQGYLLFAFALVPIERRFGIVASIATGFAVGLVPDAVQAVWHHVPYGLMHAHLYYFGIMAMGQAAAAIAFSPDRYASLRKASVWRAVSFASWATWLVLVIPQYGHGVLHTTILYDAPVGLGLASWVLAVALDGENAKRSPIIRIASTPFAIWFGTFSYSLYLVHLPIVTVIMDYAQALPPTKRIWVPFVATPFIVLFAYGFAKLFEFPFMSTYYRTSEQKALAEARRRTASVTAEAAPALVPTTPR